MLDIAAATTILREAEKTVIVAVEEPEAFLHPSAQRIVARNLLDPSQQQKVVLSTHSPVLVEEARYNQMIVASDRQFHIAREVDSNREKINSALLIGYGAEMVFSSSVLLVEGDGDRQFFEELRRRLAALDPSGRADELFVVPVGSKQSFGPWIRLIRSLNNHKETPISYLVVADSDAATDVRKAFNDAGVSVPQDLIKQLRLVAQRYGDKDWPGWIDAARDVNALTSGKINFPLMMLPGDLEWSIFCDCSENSCKTWAGEFQMQWAGQDQFTKQMGSKAIDGNGGDGRKSPWMRGAIGRTIEPEEVSDDIRGILARWLSGVMPKAEANKLLKGFLV